MNLLVFRHGAASPSVPAGGTDRDRPLSASGREAFANAARVWARIATAPSIIVASPLLRAQQTAELLVAALGGGITIESDEGLVPEADAAAFALPDEPDVCLVSHMPFVGDYVGRILAGTERGMIPMSPGQGVWIDLPSAHAVTGRLITSLTTAAAATLEP